MFHMKHQLSRLLAKMAWRIFLRVDPCRLDKPDHGDVCWVAIGYYAGVISGGKCREMLGWTVDQWRQELPSAEEALVVLTEKARET